MSEAEAPLLGTASAVPGAAAQPSAEDLLRAMFQALQSYAQQPQDKTVTQAPPPRIMRVLSSIGSMTAAGSMLREEEPSFMRGVTLKSVGSFPPDIMHLPEKSVRPHLEKIERHADFWCDLIATSTAVDLEGDAPDAPEARLRGFSSPSVPHLSEDVRENVLEEFFDLTPERVVEIYASMGSNAGGRITPEALGEGLRHCGISGLDETAPAKILEAVTRDGSLQPEEFEIVLSRLKLAQLIVGLQQHADAPCTNALHRSFEATARRLTIVDYDPRSAAVTPCTGSKLREFFFSHRTSPKVVRWVHLEGPELTLLLSLTVKYSLHPLGVEDVIEQCRTKVDRYGGHFFAAVEQLSLAGPVDPSSPVQVRGSHVSIFCSGPPNLDTVISVSQPDRSFGEDWPGATEVPKGEEAAADDWVVRLRHRIEARGSRVRERRAHFLLVQVLDLCTDSIVMVTHAYTARLGRLEAELHAGGAALAPAWLDEMSLIRLQLAVVARRARGLLRATRQLDDPDLREDLSGYLRDIVDHLDEVVEDAAGLVEKCGAIIHAYERAVERRQDQARQLAGDRLNNTLFALTVITTVLMPLQLIAAVYGMNFMDLEGKPTIPELTHPRGYLYFWTGALTYLLLCCLVSAWLWLRLRRGEGDKLAMTGGTGSDFASVAAAPAIMGRTVGPPGRLGQRRSH